MSEQPESLRRLIGITLLMAIGVILCWPVGLKIMGRHNTVLTVTSPNTWTNIEFEAGHGKEKSSVYKGTWKETRNMGKGQTIQITGKLQALDIGSTCTIKVDRRPPVQSKAVNLDLKCQGMV
jgi:hypothetical protein